MLGMHRFDNRPLSHPIQFHKRSHINFSYGDKKILQNCAITLKEGETVALFGPSGAGKSTLLKILAGIIPSEIEPLNATYMSQDDELLPWRTVIQNVTLPLELLSLPKNIEVLSHMNLDDAFNLYPHELSGGMLKRVMLARALVLNKPFLLLDEPFSSLDPPLRERLYDILKSYKSTKIIATHDFHDAISLADRIILLKEGAIQKEWEVLNREDSSYIGSLFLDLKTCIRISS